MVPKIYDHPPLFEGLLRNCHLAVSRFVLSTSDQLLQFLGRESPVYQIQALPAAGGSRARAEKQQGYSN